LDRERQLQAEISSAEQRLYRAEITRAETSGHREELGRIKKDYTVLLNDIKESWPEYYRLRTASEPLTITGIKRSLQVDQALLEYFVGDSVLYMIGVTQDSAMLHVSPADSLRDQIERLRSIIAARDKFSDPTLISEWNKTCQALFKRLIHPLTPLLKNSSRLIIISDDALNYLPFEMLIDSSGKLLLSKFSISYAASESLRREQTAMKSTGNFFGGFNADYSNHPEFPALPGASNEVNIIRDIFGFRSTAFTAATADDFRRQASRFKILHLALHSQINDEKPLFSRLVFTRAGDLEDSDITANELYSMKLNAEIVVLSACETGLGKLQRGEGMMSLSRAFMYAGVPSAVISMWKVPDQTTSILMTKFYLELKNGKQKDEALRNAKLQLIKEHPEMSHPYFWAGFIINGKTDAIDLPMFSNAEWTGISIVTFIFTITILYRFRRKFYFNLLTSSRARVE
jgi:CHAT domain-containing protein